MAVQTSSEIKHEVCNNGTGSTSYFVVKCATLDNLQDCVHNSLWACRDRSTPPHPRQLLKDAHGKGRVFLLFSVNNQRGWHGVCESLFSADADPKAERSSHRKNNSSAVISADEKDKECDPVESSVSNSSCEIWHKFPVKWLIHFQSFPQQTCLDFRQTQDITLLDGTPVNKARNWQQVSSYSGQHIFNLMEKEHSRLVENIKIKEEEEKMRKERSSFFKAEESDELAHATCDWQSVVVKVEEELGKVHLVCPFGSQRYNCDTPESDNDIFIVYQAKTTQMLGLDPPKQTIKNSEREQVDYTVLELQRYCELLVAGEAKSVETLFLADTPAVVVASLEWRELCKLGPCLLTQPCLDRYMREIQGTSGLKQFEKWRERNPDETYFPPRLAKLSYIVLRLLHHARDMVTERRLEVYHDDTSAERSELMAARSGSLTVSLFMEKVEGYLRIIQENRASIKQDGCAAKEKIQEWLIKCRLQDLERKENVCSDT